MGNKILSLQELQDSSHLIPDWEILETRLRRKFKFKDFIDAFGFMTKVAIISESMIHHPELKNVYSEVSIELTTHDLGGISQLDLKLVQAIDIIIE